MKKLIVLGLAICILLISLIFLGSNNFENSEQNMNIQSNQNNNQKENYEEVINNKSSVVQYNGYVYYVSSVNSAENGFSNKLCRRKIEDNTEEVLYNANQYKIEDRLIIFNNNIFFSMVGQTYYINLENLTQIKDYNKGILYEIGNGNLIYEYNNNLYKGTYYLKTLAINSITSIATLTPTFMFEDNNNLYFYSDNLDYSKSIVSVNKDNQTVKVLDRIYAGAKGKIDILEFKNTEEYIYLILEKDEYEIRKISKTKENVDTIKLESKPSEYIFTIDNNLYYKLYNSPTLYEYSVNENIIKEANVTNVPDTYYLKLSGKNICLYKNEEILATIVRGVETKPSNILIEEIQDLLYVKFDMLDENSEEIMFFRLRKDGNNLEKIN